MLHMFFHRHAMERAEAPCCHPAYLDLGTHGPGCSRR